MRIEAIEVTETRFCTEAGEYSTIFGLRCQLSDRQVYEIPSVDCSRDRLSRFAKRLECEHLSPVQLRYLVEDYVAGISEFR